MSRVRLASAAAVAERFGRAYARVAYLQRPPRLPGATDAVQANVRASAAHIPPRRRGRVSRSGPVQLEAETASSLDASVVVTGEGVPPFAVGFTVRRTQAGWRVTSISLPG